MSLKLIIFTFEFVLNNKGLNVFVEIKADQVLVLGLLQLLLAFLELLDETFLFLYIFLREGIVSLQSSYIVSFVVEFFD